MTLRLYAAAVFTVSAVVPAAGHAQEWPSKPMRIVVPFSPGGATDIIARLMAQRFYEVLGQPTAVDNRSGAGGNIGAEIVVRSPPDGHTLLLSTASMAVNVTLYPKIPFDVRKDLIAVTQIASAPLALSVHPSVPAKNVKELVAISKARKSGLNFGSNGTGTTSHLAGVSLQQMAGLNLVHIPYKGAGAAMISLVGGEVDFSVPAVTTARPLIAAGKLRGLAITTKRRSSVLPDLPTLDSTYPGFDIDNWFSLFVPAGTSPQIVNRLHAEIVKGLQHPDVNAWFTREGAEKVGSTPKEFAAFLRTEVDKYAKIVKASGAKPDQ